MRTPSQATTVAISRITSAGPGDWWFVYHPDGYLIDVGDQLRAERVASEINAGRVSQVFPGAIAAMETVVRMLDRSVEAEDTPEGFEPYMLADLSAALSKLRGL